MKFEEVLPLFREGRRIRKPGTSWFKLGVSNVCELDIQLLLADDWEVERPPIKYSVTLWGTEFAPLKDTVSLEGFVFGMRGEWSEKPIPKCPIKYRVTVEEIMEGEAGR